jgi:hypothetical protein
VMAMAAPVVAPVVPVAVMAMAAPVVAPVVPVAVMAMAALEVAPVVPVAAAMVAVCKRSSVIRGGWPWAGVASVNGDYVPARGCHRLSCSSAAAR